MPGSIIWVHPGKKIPEEILGGKVGRLMKNQKLVFLGIGGGKPKRKALKIPNPFGRLPGGLYTVS